MIPFVASLVLAGATTPIVDPALPVEVTIEVEPAYETRGVVMRLRLKDERPIVLDGKAVSREYKTTAVYDQSTGKIIGSVTCPTTAQLQNAGAPSGHYLVTIAQFDVLTAEVVVPPGGGSIWSLLEGNQV